MSQLNLSSHDREIVLNILRTVVPHKTVGAFGSRVKGSARKYSDLDLAVVGPEPLSFAEIATLKEAFEESDLTIRVDVVDWAAASENFRNLIMQEMVVMQKGEESG